MFCCAFRPCLFFTNLFFFPHPFQLASQYLLCFLVSITLMANLLTAYLWLTPFLFYSLSRPRHSVFWAGCTCLDPWQGRMWLIRLAGVSVVCLWRPSIGLVFVGLSTNYKDWSDLNPCVIRVSSLQLIMMVRTCISLLFDLWTSLLILSASFGKKKKGPL